MTVMKCLCTQCEGLYIENTVECPWCQSDKLVPMSVEQYNELYLDVKPEYRKEPEMESYVVFELQGGETFEVENLTKLIHEAWGDKEEEYEEDVDCETCGCTFPACDSMASLNERYCSVECEQEGEGY